MGEPGRRFWIQGGVSVRETALSTTELNRTLAQRYSSVAARELLRDYYAAVAKVLRNSSVWQSK
jgi:hypothetical protein